MRKLLILLLCLISLQVNSQVIRFIDGVDHVVYTRGAYVHVEDPMAIGAMPRIVTVNGQLVIYIGNKTIDDVIASGVVSSGYSGSIPNGSELVYHLDGTVQGDTALVDQINGYLFGIANHDFESNNYGGLPFKSIATISAPDSGETGYNEVLAIDVNNFWYAAADSSVNEIPITAFFQNVDFANQLFCRHTARVVNDSLEETTPPLVTDICGYSSAQTIDSDFTDYFGAVIEPDTAGNMWVSKDGNDGSGDGSWDYPYLTIENAYDNAADNDTIYVLSGTYDDGTHVDLDRDATTLAIIGTGLVTVQGSGSDYVIHHDDGDLVINHLIVDGEDATAQGIRQNTTDPLTVNKCKVHNVTTGTIYDFAGNNKSIYDCILLDDYSQCLHTDEMEGCYLDRLTYVNSEDFRYNKLYCSAANGVSIAHTYSGTNDTIIIEHNLFRMTNGRYGIDIYTLDIDQNDLHVFVERNRFIYTGSSGNLNSSVYVRPTDVSADGTYKCYTLVRFNEFYDSTTAAVTGGNLEFAVTEASQSNLCDSSGFSLSIEKNYMHSVSNAANREAIFINPSTYKGKIKINYNRIFMNSDEGPAISFGEGTGDQMTPGSEIIGNFIQGPYYNYPESSGGFHGILANGGEDFIIKYNWVEYCPLGYVIKDKGGLDPYTSGHGMFYNVGFNNEAQFYWRAVDSVICYNNTFVNHDSVETSRWGAMDAQEYGADTICRGHQFDNNIFSYTSKTGTGTAHFMADTAAFEGEDDFLWNNNIFDMGAGHTLWLTESGADPATFTYTQAVTETWITNGDSTTVTFADLYGGELWPQSGSNGIDDGTTLNAAYDDGLDTTSNWHGYVDSTDVDLWPTIVTKQQTGSWDRGAYVK